MKDIMELSGAERMRIGCAMFEEEKKRFLSTLGDISEREKRVKLFLHFYGDDFDEKTKAYFLKRIQEE